MTEVRMFKHAIEKIYTVTCGSIKVGKNYLHRNRTRANNKTNADNRTKQICLDQKLLLSHDFK